jgi:hypothetical protein
MSDPVAPEEYFRAIEEEFLRRRGAPMILSPRDWALISEWQAQGVPLRIALQGIANVFDAFERRAPGPRRINSLSYCRQEVLSLNELYRSLRAAGAGRPPAGGTGPAAAGPARAIGRHLGRLVRRLREAMARASASGLDPLVPELAQAVTDLKRIRKEIAGGALDPSGLEESLRRLDDALLDRARRALPEEAVREAEAAAERRLGATGVRMTAEALGRTRAALRARLLRERCGLPRLTLFE